MGKTCLVTGGLGFIGQHLVTLLQERGHAVRILDLATPQSRRSDIEYITGSITDAALVSRATQGVQQVYHLAANAGLWSPRKSEFITVNQTGTRNVMNAAIAAGVERVVHCSTESILKSVKRPGPQPGTAGPAGKTDETVALTLDDMAGAYCRGKFIAEQEAIAAAAQGLPVVVVNPTVPIGPGDRRITPPTRMMLGFLNGAYPAYLNSDLNLVDARDVALGHVLAAERGTPGERYILGNVNLSLGELLQRLEALTGLPMPKRQIPYWLAFGVSVVQEFIADYVTQSPPAAPLTGVRLARSPMAFDNAKAQRQLGLTFRPLDDSLRAAVDDYRRRGLLSRSR